MTVIAQKKGYLIVSCPLCGTPNVIATAVTTCLHCGILFWSDGRYVELQNPITELPASELGDTVTLS